MPELAFALLDGEGVVKEASDSHYLRPAAGLVGRLCHPYLTNGRLILCEAFYDIAGKREKGSGGVLHEIPLEAIETLHSSADTVEPHIELDVRNPLREPEKVFLYFRDDGWTAGAPERLAERDGWIAAIGAERKRMGLPVRTYRPEPAPSSRGDSAGRGEASASFPPAAEELPAPAPADGSPPRLLAGKYELLRRIGSGGMGIVYEGRDRTLDRLVAVKRMRPDIRMAGRDKSMFLKEAKTSAALHHPFIVDIYAVLDEGDEIYLVFEYVDGQTLQEQLDDTARLTLDKVRSALKCVCEALAYAHSCKVVHRDLKPSNIMLTRQGYAKVMDFGIARQIKDTASRLSTTKMDTSGTLPYMAPEQELGKSDLRSDIFALGVTVYELLAGELPYVGPNFYLQKERKGFKPLSEAAPDVPPELASAVERCMSFEPKDRFQSVEEFAKAVGIVS